MTFRPPFARARTIAHDAKYNNMPIPVPVAPPAVTVAPDPVAETPAPVAASNPVTEAAPIVVPNPAVDPTPDPVTETPVEAAEPVAETETAPTVEVAPEPVVEALVANVEDAAKVYDDGNQTTVFEDLAKVRKRGAPRLMSDILLDPETEDASPNATNADGGLSTLTRRELNEMAISLGIPHPEKFPNKGALAEAIHNFPKE